MVPCSNQVFRHDTNSALLNVIDAIRCELSYHLALFCHLLNILSNLFLLSFQICAFPIKLAHASVQNALILAQCFLGIRRTKKTSHDDYVWQKENKTTSEVWLCRNRSILQKSSPWSLGFIVGGFGLGGTRSHIQNGCLTDRQTQWAPEL